MKPRKPIKRSPIKKKARKSKVSWRSGKVRLDANGMRELRVEAYIRTGGWCECWKLSRTDSCGQHVNWDDGHLHHVQPRGRGGSDTIENVVLITQACHQRAHGLKP